MQIWFKLRRPGTEPIIDRTCPSCGFGRMHIHQHERARPVVDWKLDTIHQVRVKCPRCGKTGTCRPAGVAPGDHRTQAVVAFGILLYALGLSCRSAGAAIRTLAGGGSRSAVHRDVVAAGEEARRLHAARAGRSVRILGVDGTGQKIKRTGRKKQGSVGVAFAVDAETHTLVAVELVEEEDERQVRRFVKRLCRKHGVEFLMTDEHSSYVAATRSNSVAVEHRLCEAHWKKSKQNRIRSLRTGAEERGDRRMVRDLAILKRLVRDGPPDTPAQIETIHRRYLDADPPPPGTPWSPAYHLRMLTLHLLETWNRIGADTQSTNNTAERMIGLLLKIRSKTMRGFVRSDNILRFVHLMAHLREAGAPPELKAVS